MKLRAHSSFSLWLLIGLLPLFIFSYLPLIQLGKISETNIDGSLLYGALVIVVIAGGSTLWNGRAVLLRTTKWNILLAFTLYVSLSAVWSPNPSRAIITAGFFWLLFALCSITLLHASAFKQNQRLIKKLLTVALFVAGLWAFWQIIADSTGISSQWTFLPAAYSGDLFGIARPTAFALEPQFFGNMLLVPFLFLSAHVLGGTAKRRDYALLLLTSLLLLLTVSRGALIAAGVGILLLLVMQRHTHTRIAFFRLAVVALASVVLFTATTLTAAAVRDDTITAKDSLGRVVNQLSLGTLSLPQSAEPVVTPITPARPAIHQEDVPMAAEGYVASSTDSRLAMSQRAVDIWMTSPRTILGGVGIGGFGAALQQQNPDLPLGLVVNNFYLELLAETGLIGIGVFFAFLLVLIWQLAKARQFLLIALIGSLLVQWLFFSGSANVTHIWVLFGLAVACAQARNSARTTPALLQ